MNDKIEEMIFRTPEKWVHIREMARTIGISPNSVRKNIAPLKKKGIIQERKDANMIQYRANMENEQYKREKMLHNLRNIFDSEIVGFLHDYYSPNAIVLFGSYSKGEDTSKSDIDIAVVTSSKKRPDLKKFEKKLSRKIELSLFTRKEVSKEFFNNVINGIVLRGFLKYE
ncbi:MAG: nucleotidyltransferase domain-containing protein [Candidatus Aenigmatarchaeota archaeon]